MTIISVDNDISQLSYFIMNGVLRICEQYNGKKINIDTNNCCAITCDNL